MFLVIWLTSTASVLTVLEAVFELRRICLGSHSTVDPSTFGSQRYFLDFDWPITFDSKFGVSASGIFMGRVDVFSSGLEAEECLSKNEI
ncbi:hypothetical protein L195_g004266 [Trifolium pratense]|uniref:Secreted protein n=1 Tax=Trifolium pratense TaxID=57577 RepID=A0A2K3NXJ2_TRIPR|nr:hypothetical protein L195_g004266 [Trifolium pratense]